MWHTRVAEEWPKLLVLLQEGIDNLAHSLQQDHSQVHDFKLTGCQPQPLAGPRLPPFDGPFRGFALASPHGRPQGRVHR